MKKIFVVAAFASLTMVSCKKDFNCNCVGTSGGVQITETNTTIKDTEKKATDACEAMSASSSAGGLTVESTCKIK